MPTGAGEAEAAEDSGSAGVWSRETGRGGTAAERVTFEQCLQDVRERVADGG